MHTAAVYLNIDNQLRFILFGLECALDVEFDVHAVEQVFASDDAKRYDLHRSASLHVWGEVEEYEPGTLLLSVESKRAFQPSLPALVERAKYQVFRMERHADMMEQQADL